jgi:beta-lactamase regulating signal transducer with metallopeptidase domain
MNYLPIESIPAGLLDAALLLTAKLTVLLALAWLVTFAFRRMSASLRHLVWLTAVVGGLCLPFLPGVLPDWKVLPSEISITKVVTPALVVTTAVVGDAAAAASDAETVRKTPPAITAGGETTDAAHTNWPAVVATLWLLGVAVVLGRLAAGSLSVSRVVAKSRWLHDTRATAEVDRCREILGVNRRIRLAVSDDVDVPFVWGWRRPVVVLPSAAARWSIDRIRTILLHELAHARRYDTVSTLLTGVATALYWFHPLVWVAARRLKHEMERAADDCVLNAGAESTDYARHLLDVSRAATPARVAAGVALAQHSQLGGRVMAILSPRHNRTPVGGARRRLVIFAAVLAVLPLASLANHSQTPANDVSPADRAALIATLTGFYEALNVGEDYHIVESSFLTSGYFEPPEMTLETMDESAWRAVFNNTIKIMKEEGLLGPLTAEVRVTSVRREGDGYVMTLESDLITRKVVVESVVEDDVSVHVKVARGADGEELPAEEAFLIRSHEQQVRFQFEDGSWKIAEYGDGLTIRRMDTNNPYGPIYLVWLDDMGKETTPYGPMISKVIPEEYRPFNNMGVTFVLED